MGKSGRSTLVTVAVALESNPWLVGRLTEYVSKAPAMMKSGVEIEKALRSLQALPEDTTACDYLHELVVAVPTWQASLRTGARDELLQVLRAKLQSMWVHLKVVQESSMLQKVSQLLHHASLLWPLDTTLQAWVQDVGQLMQAATKGDMLTELQKKCQADVMDTQAISATVHELVTMLASLGTGIADESVLSESHVRAINGACKQILTFALSSNPMEDATWKQMHQATEMGLKLALFNSSSRANAEEDLAFVSCTLSLVAAMKKLEKAEASTEADKLMYTLALQRARDKMIQAMKSERLGSHPCFAKFSLIQDQCAEQLTKVKVALLRDSKAQLQAQLAIVSKVAGGTEVAETHWLDGMTSSTFQGLVEHAAKSLLTIDLERFNGIVQKLSEVTGALGTNPAVDFMKGCRAVASKAATTRAEARLLQLLQSAEDKAQLRTAVQAELRHMKGLGIAPKESLPPLLYEQVMLCLALRFELRRNAIAT
eukprot:6474085-Amphidinium_carterae.2